MAQVTCPVLFLLGAVDQMTTPKAAQGLIKVAQAAGKTHQVVQVPVGHHQMTEAPDATLVCPARLLAQLSQGVGTPVDAGPTAGAKRWRSHAVTALTARSLPSGLEGTTRGCSSNAL